MTTDQLTTWAAETRHAAAHPEHEWDVKALDWPLTPESVVVEVGGYKGRWALQIASRYQPRLYVFEPQPWAAAVCRAVLGESATIMKYALGTTTGPADMGEWETDGCSLVKPGGSPVWMREIGAAFRDLGIDHIDLLLMNIEGYEYTLLPHMLDQGTYPDRLMVQFHDHADVGGAGRRAIDACMADRYQVAWEYWALTAWEKR